MEAPEDPAAAPAVDPRVETLEKQVKLLRILVVVALALVAVLGVMQLWELTDRLVLSSSSHVGQSFVAVEGAGPTRLPENLPQAVLGIDIGTGGSPGLRLGEVGRNHLLLSAADTETTLFLRADTTGRSVGLGLGPSRMGLVVADDSTGTRLSLGIDSVGTAYFEVRHPDGGVYLVPLADPATAARLDSLSAL